MFKKFKFFKKNIKKYNNIFCVHRKYTEHIHCVHYSDNRKEGNILSWFPKANTQEKGVQIFNI